MFHSPFITHHTSHIDSLFFIRLTAKRLLLRSISSIIIASSSFVAFDNSKAIRYQSHTHWWFVVSVIFLYWPRRSFGILWIEHPKITLAKNHRANHIPKFSRRTFEVKITIVVWIVVSKVSLVLWFVSDHNIQLTRRARRHKSGPRPILKDPRHQIKS